MGSGLMLPSTSSPTSGHRFVMRTGPLEYSAWAKYVGLTSSVLAPHQEVMRMAHDVS